jgi:hypothetical protein
MPAAKVSKAVARYLRAKSDAVRRFIAADTGALDLNVVTRTGARAPDRSGCRRARLRRLSGAGAHV